MTNTLNYKNIQNTLDIMFDNVIKKYGNNVLFKYAFMSVKGKMYYRTYSIINKEKTPSLYIYYDKEHNDYRFKDFSSGLYGNGLLFLCIYKHKGNINNTIDDINKALSEGIFDELSKQTDIKETNAYEHINNILEPDNSVDYYSVIFNSNNVYQDFSYFTDMYSIPVRILDRYGVIFDGSIYYYTDRNGMLIQKYNPFADNKKDKFRALIKNKDYIYGISWADRRYDNVIICGAIKDMLSMVTCIEYRDIEPVNYILDRYDIRPDNTLCVAAISERVFNPVEIMSKNINFTEHNNPLNVNYFILFDNDKCGIETTKEISELLMCKYTIKPINLCSELLYDSEVKDISDLRHKHLKYETFH